MNKVKPKGFSQVCVWPGTVVGREEAKDFEEFFASEFGVRARYLEEIVTCADRDGDGSPVEGTGGRNDLFFAVHDDDVDKFAVPRLKLGIRWIEDVTAPVNGGCALYPERVKEYRTWNTEEDENEEV
jgi:hypothetical protein